MRGLGLRKRKPRVPKQSLALTDSQVDLKLLLNEGRQNFAVPQMPRQAKVFRGLPQGRTYFLPLSLTQKLGSAGTFGFFQPAQTLVLNPFYPILDGSQGVTQEPRHLPASHTLGYQKNPMKTMIVTRFRGSPNLRLERHDHCFCVWYGQSFHTDRLPDPKNIRNNL
jgi:hypothetical protein